MRSLLPFAVIILLPTCSFAQSAVRTRDLVQATVRISNPKSTATGFVLTLPKPKGQEGSQCVLVTAGHVLERTDGTDISVGFRKAAGGDFVRAPLTVKIRQDGKPNWTQNAKYDVAAIKIEPPADVDLPKLSFDVLADAAPPNSIEPGDTVRCIVYPHAGVFEASAAGFPLVRLACLASFPLPTPEKPVPFLVDYNTFEGDSGGPIVWTTENDEGKPTARILGLIKGQHWINQRYELIYESGEIRRQLGLAIVEPAAAIRETVRQLIPAE